jgi:hypothetical protein
MRVLRLITFAILSAVVAAGSAYFLVVRPRVRGWGVDPADNELDIPGDDLVPDATGVETRGVIIGAKPDDIWPWLIQMGYGRAGWYSYDALDMKGSSAERILPEFQAIAPGEVMPTHPGGGFLVKVVEPGRALVLYSDTELVRAQQAAAQAAGIGDEMPTPGLKATDAALSASFPEFAASWAFYLQPIADEETRLVERFRIRTPGSGPAKAVLGEVMGTGIVLMSRKQLLGIKARVEGTIHGTPPAEPDSVLEVLDLSEREPAPEAAQP